MNLRGKRVLLTGDSHLDWSKVGSELERLLTAEGAKVTRLAVGGTWTPQWLGDKPLCRKAVGDRDPAVLAAGQKCVNPADVVARGPYDLVLLSLGTNDAANADVKGGMRGNEPPVFVARVRQLAAKLGAPFLLVGVPTLGDKVPHYTNAAMRPYIDAAKAALGPAYFDARAVTAPFVKDSDGVHYGGKGATAWAEAVVAHVKATSFGGSGKGLKIALAVAGTLGVLGALWWLARRRAATVPQLPPPVR